MVTDYHNLSHNMTVDQRIYGEQIIIMNFVFPVVVIMGIIGNSLSIAVIKRNGKLRSSTTIYFVTQAVSDTINLILAIPYMWNRKSFFSMLIH